MKTTVLINTEQRICVAPSMDPKRPIVLTVLGNLGSVSMHMTMDQVGALLFGIEQAAEAVEIQQQRAAAGARGADPQPTGQE